MILDIRYVFRWNYSINEMIPCSSNIIFHNLYSLKRKFFELISLSDWWFLELYSTFFKLWSNNFNDFSKIDTSSFCATQLYIVSYFFAWNYEGLSKKISNELPCYPKSPWLCWKLLFIWRRKCSSRKSEANFSPHYQKTQTLLPIILRYCTYLITKFWVSFTV